MNTQFKKALLLLVITTIAVSGLAQQNHVVTFSYDANGNRTSISVGFKKSEENGRNVENENSVLSIAEDVFESMRVSIYPNPTQDNVNVFVENSMKDVLLHVRLITSGGSVIAQKIVNGSVESIDISPLASGVYFLELTSGQEKHVWKVIKK